MLVGTPEKMPLCGMLARPAMTARPARMMSGTVIRGPLSWISCSADRPRGSPKNVYQIVRVM